MSLAEKKAKKARMRRKAIEELLSTEKTYVNLMNGLVEHYVTNLATKTSLLSFEDHKILFPSDIHTILGLHQIFLSDLKKIIESDTFNNNTSKIGDIIYAFCPHFKMYQNYLNNYSKAQTKLSTLRRTNNSFSSYCLKQMNSKLFNGLSLEALIILPIQRMPRYKMLLEEIIKHTELDHPDLKTLKDGLIKITDVNMTINERMKEFDARKEVKEIENRFNKLPLNVNLVEPSRRYVKQGILFKVENKDDEQYLFILFNDCLLYAAQSTIGGKLTFGNLLHFNNTFSIKKTDQKINVHNIDNLFEIHSFEESFMLYTATDKEMIEWIDIINKTSNNYLSLPTNQYKQDADINKYPAPLFMPNDFTEKCMINGCQTNFGMFTRKHHCYYCGLIVCSKCSQNNLPPKGVISCSPQAMVRVCDICHKINIKLVNKSKTIDTKPPPPPVLTSNKKEELLKMYQKREQELVDTTADDNINDNNDDNTDNTDAVAMQQPKHQKQSSLLNFLELDIEPKLNELEIIKSSLEKQVISLKEENKSLQYNVSNLRNDINDLKYSQQEQQTEIHKYKLKNNELLNDNKRLQALVSSLTSSTNDQKNQLDQVYNNKINTLQNHNNNLKNELIKKEEIIKELQQKQTKLQQKLNINDNDDTSESTNKPVITQKPPTPRTPPTTPFTPVVTQTKNKSDDEKTPVSSIKTQTKSQSQSPDVNINYNNPYLLAFKSKSDRICAACKNKIIGRGFKTKNGIYHRKCHKCAECKQSLMGKKYGILDQNGIKKKLCELCVDKANELIKKQERIKQVKAAQQAKNNNNNNITRKRAASRGSSAALAQQLKRLHSGNVKVHKPWQMSTASASTSTGKSNKSVKVPKLWEMSKPTKPKPTTATGTASATTTAAPASTSGSGSGSTTATATASVSTSASTVKSNKSVKVPKIWEMSKPKKTATNPKPKPTPATAPVSTSVSASNTIKSKRTNIYQPNLAFSGIIGGPKRKKSSSLNAQRKCGRCKGAIFGLKGGIIGPNNSIYHQNCFKCQDCDNELKKNKWRSYPLAKSKTKSKSKGKKGGKRTTLLLCQDCVKKRDEALFSVHSGKLKI